MTLAVKITVVTLRHMIHFLGVIRGISAHFLSPVFDTLIRNFVNITTGFGLS